MGRENQETRMWWRGGVLPERAASTQLPVTASKCKGEFEVIRAFNFSREARNLDFHVKPQFLNVA